MRRTAQELPSHPRLLLDHADVETLKTKIAGPFAKQWSTFRGEVDAAMSKPIDLPPRGGNWSHNYVCPSTAPASRLASRSGRGNGNTFAPLAPHILTGDPSKGTLDFDGNEISSIHLNYADQLVNLGVVYQITGDAKYAQRAREILLAYADKYLAYPLHNNEGKLGSGGHVESQSLTEASWLIQISQVAGFGLGHALRCRPHGDL